MKAIFSEISGSDKWRTIEPINKGWSDDKKYHIVTNRGMQLQLRISDISKYEARKKDYETLKRLDKMDVLISRPIDFGICNQGKHVYFLLSWLSGEDLKDVLCTLNIDEQYKLGVKAGEALRKLHSIPAPENYILWTDHFNRKIDRNINTYYACGIEIHGADNIIDYIEKNRYLLDNRPQTFQHGDFHIGNMIITHNGEIGIIDFDRLDYGDPWEEFNRIVWCANVSSVFAAGRINGYFENDVPEVFFRLMALYIASNLLSSVPWAIPYGQEQVDIMRNQACYVLKWYDQFQTVVPKWYLPYRNCICQ
ncbi:aminoglycoside phosphotransferase family protein [Sporomusa sp. KB1]|uniref:aminoglycoside phosphotransferase family protein n=1 Tax=Sporomusa sp. KB1 TaxID=943346 RepID=UPI0011A70769|nr:phosphotransferase family protein [Sporomusa sp. KB1]TWH47737.1 aminoglycoside phosphotransferase (APT) family kinase protein [Sporomusa sp. KB1]